MTFGEIKMFIMRRSSWLHGEHNLCKAPTSLSRVAAEHIFRPKSALRHGAVPTWTRSTVCFVRLFLSVNVLSGRLRACDVHGCGSVGNTGLRLPTGSASCSGSSCSEVGVGLPKVFHLTWKNTAMSMNQAFAVAIGWRGAAHFDV